MENTLHKEHGQLAIATITWARQPDEENLLREALTILSTFNIPVFITDGGSGESFIEFLHSLPNISLCKAEVKGLWPQVKSSLVAARQSGATSILYTEPDKKNFFQHHLDSFLQAAKQQQEGLLLASRTAPAFSTFPPFQQHCETTINYCCAEVTGKPFDYTYGPFLITSELVSSTEHLEPGAGWGWRPFVFCMAHRLGYDIKELPGLFECPPDQRTDDPTERIYRMKQLHESIKGIVVATAVQME